MSSGNLIQTNAMCVLNNNWRDFYFVSFSIFICLKAITNLKKGVQRTISDRIIFRERMKQFLLMTLYSYDQKCAFGLHITPRQCNVAVWPHAVALNSESYSYIPRFCDVSLSCTRGATGKVQSCSSQQHALYSTPVRPACF